MAIDISEKDDISYSKAIRVFLWIAQIIGAAIFFLAGLNKWMGNPEMVQVFDKVGFGQWFRYFAGGVEILAAGLLLTRHYSGVGALLLVPVMVGAILTHLFVIGGSPMIPILLLTLMTIVAIGRQDQIIEFFSGFSSGRRL